MKNKQKCVIPRIGRLISAIALGDVGKAYMNRVTKWLQTNGMEWTNNRCKVLWNVALSLRCGNITDAIKLYQENSISYNKVSHLPKGPEGRLIREFLHAQRPVVLRRISALLRIYTSFILGAPSNLQVKKAVENITAPYSGSMPLNEVYQLGKDLMAKHVETCPELGALTIHNVLEPLGLQHLRVNAAYYSKISNKDLPYQYKGKPFVHMASSMMTKPHIPLVIHNITPGKEFREAWEQLLKNCGCEDPYPYGRITMLQEQGCKARVVFMPTLWVQLSFAPLHKRLAYISELLFTKESCVNDQTKGIYQILEHISKGGSVYCTDLKSATDRIPVSFIYGILDALKLETYSAALREILSTEIYFPYYGKKSLKYSVGQPMGLYGSFPLLNISNGLIAELSTLPGIEKGEPSFPDGTYFKILGDDIVFSNAMSESKYREIVQSLGISISDTKSFKGTVGEFAGFVILKTNKDVTAYRPYKVPTGDMITNPVQFLDAIGIKVKSIENPHQRRKLEKLLNIFNQSREFRGLDLSPLISLNEVSKESQPAGDMARLGKLCHRLAHMCTHKILGPSGKCHFQDFIMALENAYTERRDLGIDNPLELESFDLFLQQSNKDFYVYDEKHLRSREFRESEKFHLARVPLAKDQLKQMKSLTEFVNKSKANNKVHNTVDQPTKSEMTDSSEENNKELEQQSNAPKLDESPLMEEPIQINGKVQWYPTNRFLSWKTVLLGVGVLGVVAFTGWLLYRYNKKIEVPSQSDVADVINHLNDYQLQQLADYCALVEPNEPVTLELIKRAFPNIII